MNLDKRIHLRIKRAMQALNDMIYEDVGDEIVKLSNLQSAIERKKMAPHAEVNELLEKLRLAYPNTTTRANVTMKRRLNRRREKLGLPPL